MIPKAREFLLREARVLERRRFEALFEGGDPGPVIAALEAYRNADGGFGNALEPDLRCGASQPVGVQTAMEILHETGETAAHPFVAPACDFIGSIQRDDGGIPFALESAMGEPHAPWWTYSPKSSVTQSMANAAALHRLGAQHPALDQLDAFCWKAAESLDLEALDPGPGSGYDLLFTIAFLNATPDEPRARTCLDSIGTQLPGSDLVSPGNSGDELPNPLNLAPLPSDRSRSLFKPAEIEAELDHLAASQLDDGGWDFAWPKWNSAAAHEWRGVVTLSALKTLAANGRH